MKNLLILLGLLPFLSYSQSQSSAIEFQLNSASNFHKIESLQTSWAVGEIFTDTFRHNDVLVTMGINNNNAIYTITGNGRFEVTPNIDVFPIPFTNELFINHDNNGKGISNIRISDLNGKEVMTWNKIEEGIIHLDTNEISPALYFLKIYVDHSTVPTIFKIIKK